MKEIQVVEHQEKDFGPTLDPQTMLCLERKHKWKGFSQVKKALILQWQMVQTSSKFKDLPLLKNKWIKRN